MPDSTHVVCAHCDSVVRVPTAKLAAAPRCPKCRATLIEGDTIDLRAANFDQHINRNDLPVVVDFWAPWCGPCKMMAPHFKTAAQKFAQQARLAKVNSDDEPTLSSRFGIRGIPTLIAFRDGKEIARQSGAMDLSTLERWLTSVLN